MDFAKTAFSQLNDLYKSMTPAARVTAGLLLVVIVVSLAFLFRSSAPDPEDYLFGGEVFSVKELDAMEAAFAKADLKVWRRDHNRMRVPAGQRAEYIAALADAGALPASFDDYLDEAVAVASPFEAKDQREARQRNAMQKRLSQIISGMSGIELATVTYDEQLKQGFPRRVEKSANVAVWAEPGESLNEARIDAIRHTVAGSIAGLAPESVTVVDQVAGVSYSGENEDGGVMSAKDDPYADRKQRYESQWRSKIERSLSMVPGVVVEVNVELDPDLIHEQESVKVDPVTTPIVSKDSTKSIISNSSRPGGRPGAVPNVAANSQATLSSAEKTESQTEESQSEQKSVASHTRTVGGRAALAPTHVSASIGVPESYYHKVWLRKNPPVEGDEAKAPDEAALKLIREETKRTIEEAVVGLFPKPAAGEDPFPQVRVNTFPDLPTPAPPAPSMTETAASWFAGNWEMLAVAIAALISLLMLRGMIRQTPDTEGSASQAEAALRLTEQPGEADEDDDRPMVRRFMETPNLRDELTEMVREDPAAAANVLRNWIGEVS